MNAPQNSQPHWPNNAGASPDLPTLDDHMALDLLEELGASDASAALEPLPLSAAEAEYANAAPALSLPSHWPPPALAPAPKNVHWGVGGGVSPEDAAMRDAAAPRPATAPGAQFSTYTPPLPPRPASHDAAVLAAREAEYAAALSGLMPQHQQQPVAVAALPPWGGAPPPPPPPPPTTTTPTRPPTPADDTVTAFHGASYGAGPSTSSGWPGAASSQSGGGGGEHDAHWTSAADDDASWWAAPGLRRALRAVRRPRAPRDAPGPAHAPPPTDGPQSDDDSPPRPPRSLTRMLRTACAVFDFLRAGPQSEAAIRSALGNTQDVSKGLRRLLADRLVVRTGRGGRQAPFLYSISPRGANTAHWAVAVPPPPTPIDELDAGAGHYWDAGLAFNVW